MQDQKINIAIGRSAKSKIWKNSAMLFDPQGEYPDKEACH